ncbi:autoinducer 2 ABC transporter substrate-binding protein [Meridianimarinicoccus roseus]|jgi:rhamnose transport system substrate-binding protein|uniref:Autoinducer 2 ABC transporter substrate-binding protein n=1 Tax=Meridianimarinicoccus roseus TaxID=2072018 RepID=A0A2V2LJR9_9RHOB|nr:autoinducer 2 ABC transporter substrate-binding protein [Meridianimarinicoccus roseus]PWR02083.1 autoinducer 2 ABC transporter substrate-binding protein [Meridianimarinicoccus roseus]
MTIARLASCLSIAALSAALPLSVAAQDTPSVAFVPQLIGIPYFNAMENGGNAAAEDLGMQFIYQGPVDANPLDQLQIVESLISRGVDAIAVSVLDASAIAPLVDSAASQDAILFTSDSDAADSGRPVYVAQATDEGLGFKLIDELVARVGDDATIGIVSGEATASNLNAWIGFMRDRVAAEYPGVTLLDPEFAGGTAERAAQLSTDLIAAHPDLDAIIAVASSTCPGVAQAIETSGKEIMGTGYCSPNTARAYLKSGAFGFTVLWDPYQLGYLTVWAGKQLIDGAGFAAENEVPTFDAPVTFDAETGILLLGEPFVFTAENVDDFDF